MFVQHFFIVHLAVTALMNYSTGVIIPLCSLWLKMTNNMGSNCRTKSQPIGAQSLTHCVLIKMQRLYAKTVHGPFIVERKSSEFGEIL